VIKKNVVSKWPAVKPHRHISVHLFKISMVDCHSASPARCLHHWDITKSLALSHSSATVSILWQSISLTATMNTAAITPQMSARFTDLHCTIPRKLDNKQETQIQTETSRNVCVVASIIQIMRFTEHIPSWDAYNLSAHVTLRHTENVNVH
jgi:hypothetical protein